MTQISATQQGSAGDKNAIRPFQKVNIPEAELTELRRRHFAAWEQPKLLSEEIRTGFRSLRKRSAAEAA